MSNLFTSPFTQSDSFKEGEVLFVDAKRFTSTVRTTSGQTLQDVTWLLPVGGSSKDGVHMTPSPYDKVLMWTGGSSPLIIGSIPRMGLSDENPLSVSGNSSGADPGNGSNLSNGFTLNPQKPEDFLPGDKVLSSKGGGVIALLRTGGVVLKSSALSQIVISKFNGLVRIVARNFQRFSDASSEVSANIKGALYKWVGVDWDLARTTSNTERYNEAYGNIPAAELYRGEPTSLVVPPPRDSRVRNYWLKDVNGYSVMTETLYEDGKHIIQVSSPTAGTTITTTDDSLWQTSVTSEISSIITILPQSITLVHEGDKTIKIDGSSILLDFEGLSTLELTASGIHGAFNGHFITIDSSGTHLG